MNFVRRSLVSLPARMGVRHAHHGHHAPVKNIDLNIALEGVESRWSSLVQEQKAVVIKQAQEAMKQDWKKLSANQKKTLYFVAFRSNEYPQAEMGKVFGGVIMILGATGLLFTGLRAYGIHSVSFFFLLLLSWVKISFSLGGAGRSVVLWKVIFCKGAFNPYCNINRRRTLVLIPSLSLLSLLSFLVAPPPPRTMTKEWKEAENVYARKQNANPISGLSSEGYKGKGMASGLSFV